MIQVVAPHRLTEYGGTEFDPAGRQHLLLVGDETAVPALARILADLGPGYTGEVFVEVPTSADILDLPSRPGFEVTWFARDEGAVRASPGAGGTPPPRPAAVDGVRGPARAAERPRHRRLGDAALLSSPGRTSRSSCRRRSLGHDWDDTYAWIAGESWLVKALRRSLVTELGLERAQVAFMGYWREGVAMKS